MTITIGTQKNLPDAHYIGRNGTSSLGNPYAAAGNTVANVVKGYRYYLHYVVNQGEYPAEAARMVQRSHPELKLSLSYGWKIPSTLEVQDEISGLRDKVRRGEPVALACHCYTKPAEWTGQYAYRCHAEPIAGWLMWQLAQDKLPIA